MSTKHVDQKHCMDMASERVRTHTVVEREREIRSWGNEEPPEYNLTRVWLGQLVLKYSPCINNIYQC